ncbi:MAG: hypothetical protein KDB22_23755 [Planctomycetales bacterium]|nr:hypothetical protein [Planctomycetales bacterium]
MTIIMRGVVYVWTLLVLFVPGVVLGEDISPKQLVEIWNETRIHQVSCRFRYSQSNKASSVASSAFGGSTNTPQTELDVNGRFCRHSELGMFLDMDYMACNLLDGIGKSVWKPNLQRNEGLYSVGIRREGETQVQSDAVSGWFLAWVDPLATRLFTNIAGLGSFQFPIVRDSEYGEIIRIELGEQAVVLAKKFEWRPISISRDRNNRPSTRNRLAYESTDGQPRLLSVDSTRFDSNGSVLIQSNLYVEDWNFTCTRTEIELPIPSDSYVVDYSGVETESYFIRADGGRRDYDESEAKLAASLREFADSEPGELYSKQKTGAGYYFLLVGLAICGTAILLAVRKSKQ